MVVVEVVEVMVGMVLVVDMKEVMAVEEAVEAGEIRKGRMDQWMIGSCKAVASAEQTSPGSEHDSQERSEDHQGTSRRATNDVCLR